jgi:hypothetical protein
VLSEVQLIDELLKATRKFGARAGRDLATLETLVAEEYLHTDIEGRVFPRSEWLSSVKSQIHGYTIRFHDLKAMVFGNIGIVTGANAIGDGARPIGPIHAILGLAGRAMATCRVSSNAGLAATNVIAFVARGPISRFGRPRKQRGSEQHVTRNRLQL